MNIFWLHDNPYTNATYHCDKHIKKMVLETAQMLSTAVHMVEAPSSNVYKKAYVNHPCTVWARESWENFIELWRLGVALGEEWSYRYGREDKPTHKSYKVIKDMDLTTISSKFLQRIEASPLAYDWVTVSGSTTKPQCMPDEYKTTNTIQAYRNYYIGDKLLDKGIVSYDKGRNVPEFLQGVL